MIKQLLNSVIAKYRDLSIVNYFLSLRLQQIIDLLATDTIFAQHRPIIINDCIK